MKTGRILLLCLIATAFFSRPDLKAEAVADTAALIVEDFNNARSLIISEVQMQRGQDLWSYFELANTGDKPLDLSRYFVYSFWGNYYWDRNVGDYPQWLIEPKGMLDAGGVYMFIVRQWNWGEDQYGNLNYPSGYTNWEGELESDTVFSRQGGNQALIEDPEIIYKAGPESKLGLVYRNQVTEYQDSVFPDSLFIDRFGVARNDLPDGNIDAQDAWRFPIAGVAADFPTGARVYVRKYSVKKGNTVEGDELNDFPTIEWDNSRGTDLDDSEWIPLPRAMNHEYDKIFTTVGYHGPTPELSVTSSVATVDKGGEKITLPYGTSRDSVFRLFDFGVNHAWELKLGADTGKFFVQDDDSIFIYTAGDKMDIYKFGIELSKDLPNFAQVAPKVYKNDNLVFTRRYDISNGQEPMDTIGTLPFNTPVDTFFAYMEKDPNASWEIVPADGQKRPEVKDGDYLRVTSPNGQVKKDYYLGVSPFFANDNSSLSNIILPGHEIFENPETYLPTDTLMGFSSGNNFYSINLPSDEVVSPAINARLSDERATMVIERAKDIRGSEEDRTATITVTAEDDSTTTVYKLLFNVERPTPPVKGDLFITDVATGWGATQNDYNYQFFNPTDEAIDLSDYVIMFYQVNNWSKLVSSFQNDSNWASNNSHVFRFGSIIEPSEDLTPVFKPDLVQKTLLLEPKDVYAIATKGGFPVHNAQNGDSEANFTKIDQNIDLIVGGNPAEATKSVWNTKGWLAYANSRYGSADPYGSNSLPLNIIQKAGRIAQWNKSWATPWFGIARILNDSIKDGTKHVLGNFEEDYEWVDVFGGVSRTTSDPCILYENDTLYDVSAYNAKNYGLYRKAHIYTGNPVDGKSFGLADPVSHKTFYENEWVFYGADNNGTQVNNDTEEIEGLRDTRDRRLNAHTMITYAHIPYLTSAKYILEEGLEGPQEIFGVTAGTTADQFLSNVDKADTGMVIKVLAANGDELASDDIISAGTNVWSKSASGADSVNYVIKSLGDLDNACALTSTVYTIETTAPTGKIKGVNFGTSLSEVLDNVSGPATAIILVTDGANRNLPLEQYNNDTIAAQNREPVKVLASEKTFIEVIAQDKVTKCVYAIEFEDEENPYILSDAYVIDQTSKIINFANRTSPAGFIRHLIASPGASIKIVNKYDQERTIGMMEYSDRVVVSKGDKYVEYWVNYSINEDVIGVNNKEITRSQFSVYPNPTTDFVTVNGEMNKPVEIRDLTGKLISRKEFSSNEAVIDLKGLQSGIYILSVGDKSYKIIKE